MHWGTFLAVILLAATTHAVRAGAIHDAARRGDLQTIRKAVSADPDAVSAVESGGLRRTPLHLAIAHKQAGAATLLLSLGAAIDAVDYQGLTPLHVAIRHEQTQIAVLLIDRGADLSLATKVFAGARNQTALHLAAAENNVVVLRRLIVAKAAVDVVDSNGRQPLHLAVMKGTRATAETDRAALSIIPVLLEAGADVHAIDELGATPLHLAAQRGMVGSTKRLVAAGADPRLPNSKGKTPINLAVDAGHLDLAQWLQSQPVREARPADSTPPADNTPAE